MIEDIRREKRVGPDIPFDQLKEFGMIDYRPTIDTPAQAGPLRFMYFFKAAEFKHFAKYMEHFCSTFKIGEIRLKNLTFYNGEYKNLDDTLFLTYSDEDGASAKMTKRDYEFLLENKFIFKEVYEWVIPEE